MMRPPPAWRICGMAPCASIIAPRRLTSKLCFHCSGVVDKKLSEPESDPALFSRKSSLPKIESVLPIPILISSAQATSRIRDIAHPPEPAISATSPSSRSGRSRVFPSASIAPSTSVTTTAAPSDASLRAIARPIPRGADAPVTNATLPSNGCMLCPRRMRKPAHVRTPVTPSFKSVLPGRTTVPSR